MLADKHLQRKTSFCCPSARSGDWFQDLWNTKICSRCSSHILLPHRRSLVEYLKCKSYVNSCYTVLSREQRQGQKPARVQCRCDIFILEYFPSDVGRIYGCGHAKRERASCASVAVGQLKSREINTDETHMLEKGKGFRRVAISLLQSTGFKGYLNIAVQYYQQK